MADQIEFGLDTFGDVTVGLDDAPLSHAQVIRNLVAEGVLADELGIDFIGVGEHHRADFAVSAPEVVLAGIATATKRIKLGSAVTVLSSDDPIRVFQRFATLDALSNGRAEVILGRGSFTESFPLFGYELSRYEELFTDKLDLFAKLARGGTAPEQALMKLYASDCRQNVARVAFKRGVYMRDFVLQFAEYLSDRLNRKLIAMAMTGHINDYEL